MSEMTTPNAEPHRQSRLPLLGLLLVVAAPFAYWSLMRFPTLRATGLAAFVTAGAGCLLGLAGVWRGTNRRGHILAGAGLVLTALYGAAFFGLAALPAAAATLIVGKPVPTFTLPDQNGRMVSLEESHTDGPTLLVFYRGFW